ncbi:hypothetical protein BV898_10019 [Hypsibius exemplaris]|uniref:Ubiquitin-like domain-containing protein n=1 Tax=Hypsibius exemplaris TaxID=2072580 RepID=A0A1W0WL40_HYPEX|nr:hypothetical protein BV898_10019 [Hypsibius exemplaris]
MLVAVPNTPRTASPTDRAQHTRTAHAHSTIASTSHSRNDMFRKSLALDVDIAEEQRAVDIFLNHFKSNFHFNAVYFAADVEMSGEKRADDFESPSSVPAKGKFFKKTTSVKYFIQTSVQSDYYKDSDLVFRGKPMESLKETDAIPATVTVDILPCFDEGFLNAEKVATFGELESGDGESAFTVTTSKRLAVREPSVAGSDVARPVGKKRVTHTTFLSDDDEDSTPLDKSSKRDQNGRDKSRENSSDQHGDGEHCHIIVHKDNPVKRMKKENVVCDRLLEDEENVEADSSSSVELRIQTGSSVYHVRARKTNTVAHSKQLLDSKFGLAPEDFRISTLSTHHDEERTIRSYGLNRHSTLSISGRLRDGMFGAMPQINHFQYLVPNAENYRLFQQNWDDAAPYLSPENFIKVVMGFVSEDGAFPINKQLTKEYYRTYLRSIETIRLTLEAASIRIEQLIRILLNRMGNAVAAIKFKHWAVGQILEFYEKAEMFGANPRTPEYIQLKEKFQHKNYLAL